MKTGEAITSPIFFVGFQNRYQWRLVLYPQGIDESNKEFVSLYLRLVADDDNSHLAVETMFSFSIIDCTGEKVHTRQSNQKSCFIKGKNLWGFSRFLHRQLLFEGDCQFLHGPPKYSRLVILCENTGAKATNDLPIECNLLQVVMNDNILKLSEDFQTLLEDSLFSDVKLISSSGEETHAHKVILAARSPVFAAMFKHDMKEKAESVVIIEDVRHEIVKEMLRFIYTGNIVDIENTVFELLPVADKYDLVNLKNICEEEIFNRLTMNNAIELLICADMYHALRLKLRITSFVIKNRKDVIATQGFKLAMNTNPRILAEIFQNLET